MNQAEMNVAAAIHAVYAALAQEQNQAEMNVAAAIDAVYAALAQNHESRIANQRSSVGCLG